MDAMTDQRDGIVSKTQEITQESTELGRRNFGVLASARTPAGNMELCKVIKMSSGAGPRGRACRGWGLWEGMLGNGEVSERWSTGGLWVEGEL